jgi:hypothetical protein
MSLTILPLGRNNSVMTSLFPPRVSLVVTSRLGMGNSRTFFYGVPDTQRDKRRRERKGRAFIMALHAEKERLLKPNDSKKTCFLYISFTMEETLIMGNRNVARVYRILAGRGEAF